MIKLSFSKILSLICFSTITSTAVLSLSSCNLFGKKVSSLVISKVDNSKLDSVEKSRSLIDGVVSPELVLKAEGKTVNDASFYITKVTEKIDGEEREIVS
jgi:hypothetical protein